MKKLMSVVIPVKSFAALIFTGLVCLYMVMGSLCAAIMNTPFTYSIPFVFILQGLVLSLVVSALWGVFFSDALFKKMRYLPRLIIFSIIIMILWAVCLLVFFAIPTAWAKLWLIVAGCVSVAVIILSVLAELYFKKTGKRYTELLKGYKSNIR